MTQRKYRVAVILLNYNSSQFTLDCVASILQRTTSSISYQIIVVDNNSSEEEYQKLSALPQLDHIQLYRTRVNKGFSGGNMVGVEYANADYYYFLNNDCLLYNDCLQILTTFMDENPSVANCSGEMFNEKGEYESVFGYFPSLALRLFGSGLLRLINSQSYPDKYIRYDKPLQVDRVSGSSMFIRAIPFELIGGFDIIYFLYCEEEDIALRLKRAGYMTYLVPEARYQHLANKSSMPDQGIRMPMLKENFISLNYYFLKNYGQAHAWGIRLLYSLKYGFKGISKPDYLKLSWFILRGAPLRDSLRFKTKIRPIDV